MTVFDVGPPRCHIYTYFWYPYKNVIFGIPKGSPFSIWRCLHLVTLRMYISLAVTAITLTVRGWSPIRIRRKIRLLRSDFSDLRTTCVNGLFFLSPFRVHSYVSRYFRWTAQNGILLRCLTSFMHSQLYGSTTSRLKDARGMGYHFRRSPRTQPRGFIWRGLLYRKEIKSARPLWRWNPAGTIRDPN
jgi:hypothetical protein